MTYIFSIFCLGGLLFLGYFLSRKLDAAIKEWKRGTYDDYEKEDSVHQDCRRF